MRHPTPDLQLGDTVLDLGSGGGKTCFVAAQIVGPSGRVIGIDVNAEMLALARRHAPSVAGKLGFGNVEFRRGRLEDLAINLDSLDRRLADHPVSGVEQLARLENFVTQQRQNDPLVASDSVDVVVSNCVLNLVRDEDKRKVFAESFRVLRRGGRAVISDIVADEPVPDHLKNDPELWSGCVSGALEQNEFLRAFEQAGFYGIEILKRDRAPVAHRRRNRVSLNHGARVQRQAGCLPRLQSGGHLSRTVAQGRRRRRAYAHTWPADGGMRKDVPHLFERAVR